MINEILEFDEKISNQIRIPEKLLVMRKFASFFAHTGDSWYLEIALFIIWLFTKGSWHTYSALFAGAIIIQALIVISIKFLIKRRRPEGSWGKIYRNTDPHSFPSGHAARVIMLSVISFGLGMQTLGWIVLIWGILVSFARVGLGVHYLVDIGIGWGIGALLGKAILITRFIFFKLFPFVF